MVNKIFSLIEHSMAPQLDAGPESIAEQLVFLMHQGVDWTVWGGERRYRYWDAFSDRVRAATYAGSTLQDWWEALEKQIKSSPKSQEDRELITILLNQNKKDQRLILFALRKHSNTLVMRIRVHIESSRKDNDAKELA